MLGPLIGKVALVAAQPNVLSDGEICDDHREWDLARG
jgi:hypothetical protein